MWILLAVEVQFEINIPAAGRIILHQDENPLIKSVGSVDTGCNWRLPPSVGVTLCHDKRGLHEAPGKSAKASGTKVCPYSHPSSQNSSGSSVGNPLTTSADLCRTTPKHLKTMCRRPTPPGSSLPFANCKCINTEILLMNNTSNLTGLPAFSRVRAPQYCLHTCRVCLILIQVTEILQSFSGMFWGICFSSTELESAFLGIGKTVISANQCGLWNHPEVWNMLDLQSFACLKYDTTLLRCPGVKWCLFLVQVKPSTPATTINTQTCRYLPTVPRAYRPSIPHSCPRSPTVVSTGT